MWLYKVVGKIDVKKKWLFYYEEIWMFEVWIGGCYGWLMKVYVGNK